MIHLAEVRGAAILGVVSPPETTEDYDLQLDSNCWLFSFFDGFGGRLHCP